MSVDYYEKVASVLFGKPANEITQDERRFAKRACLVVGMFGPPERPKPTRYGEGISDMLLQKCKTAGLLHEATEKMIAGYLARGYKVSQIWDEIVITAKGVEE